MPFCTHVMSKVILVMGSVNQTMKMGHCCGHGEATINNASILMCCENKKTIKLELICLAVCLYMYD